MLNGEIRGKIDALWNAFWTGGISNPLEVIEQITAVEKLKTAQRASLAELDALFAALQHRAFRGKL
jgi:type I restriction enzyme M protein